MVANFPGQLDNRYFIFRVRSRYTENLKIERHELYQKTEIDT